MARWGFWARGGCDRLEPMQGSAATGSAVLILLHEGLVRQTRPLLTLARVHQGKEVVAEGARRPVCRARGRGQARPCPGQILEPVSMGRSAENVMIA